MAVLNKITCVHIVSRTFTLCKPPFITKIAREKKGKEGFDNSALVNLLYNIIIIIYIIIIILYNKFTKALLSKPSFPFFSRAILVIYIIIINNLFKVGVLNERLIAIKKLIKANYL